jgi:sec-independent protein translocase protein TatC
MPVMSWILAKMRLLKHSYMTSYRKHVIIGILILAAIITPTSDAFTLMLVSIPMWMLYELSILIVKFTNKDKTL